MNTRLVEHGNRKSVPDVPERVKAAAEILSVTPGPIDYQKIAATVGYKDARALRKALSLPQSIRFLRDYKRQTLEEINMRNPEALRKVRDESANGMAVTAAVRQLEVMQSGEEASDFGRTPRQAAGITIILHHPDGSMEPLPPPAPEPPLIEHEPSSHAWPSVD